MNMIEKVLIRGYRIFRELVFEPNPRMNVLVGDNDTGKSTILEAISLGLTGKLNGHWAVEELNPYWFNQDIVENFFRMYGTDYQVAPPEIEIELYLASPEAEVQRLRGVHNSLTADCPGLRLHIRPSTDFSQEFDEYMAGDHPAVLPVEFYECEWRDFEGRTVRRRPNLLGLSFIDSRTIRSSAGVDYHTRQILSSFLDSRERAHIAVAHRKSRHQITTDALGAINEQMAKDSLDLHDKSIGLAMDQSARASWESGVVPQVSDIPFAMIGQGQQAMIKVALAMRRKSEQTSFVLIEEPETHLSYNALQRLIARIENLASEHQQMFITTHSSYVLNRLGIDNLLLIGPTGISTIISLDPDTIAYFKHLSGYDTLRLVLATRLVLVEGPSDEMVFARAFFDLVGCWPTDQGIDIVSMNGVAFARALELCARLGRRVVALQDNDGSQPVDIEADLDEYLSDDRMMCVGEPTDGRTLEPQIIKANGAETMRRVLELRPQDNPETWMPNHKTESALRILESHESIVFPQYIQDAVKFYQ